MKTKRLLVVWLAFALLALAFAADSPAKERSEIAAQYKWDLTALYKNADAVKKAKEDILADADKLAAFKGKLTESAATFKAALDLYWDIEQRLRRLESYAQRSADQDARVSDNKALLSETQTIRTKFAGAASFVEP